MTEGAPGSIAFAEATGSRLEGAEEQGRRARGRSSLATWLFRLQAPIDARGLASFRILFGLLGVVSASRFIAYGWIDELFVRPTFFFHYWGAGAVRPLSAEGMHALFPALAAISACVALGLFYRVAIVLFTLGWTYVQLCDLTNYLNHYYFVSLLGLLMAFMPLDRAWSVGALWRGRAKPARGAPTLPAWCLYLLRFQVGVVYTYAGVAKLSSDWLLHAQPLDIWLSSRTSLPLLGHLLAHPWAPLAMSWAGCLFDLGIVAFLLQRRTRPWAYGAVVVFHALTRTLFPIGMFSAIMVTAATVFFDAAWPARAWERVRALWDQKPPMAERRLDPNRDGVLAPMAPEGPREASWGSTAHGGESVSWRQRVALGAFGLYAAVQLLMPLRTHLYGGNVLWHEQGMRFSWRVMVREKNASVRYEVEDPRTGRVTEVAPERYLTTRQLREFGTQPDMILQLAHHIAAEFEARHGLRPKVRAHAQASLNGRPLAALVDPQRDLAAISDSLAPADWISPSPQTSPPDLRPIAWTTRTLAPAL